MNQIRASWLSPKRTTSAIERGEDRRRRSKRDTERKYGDNGLRNRFIVVRLRLIAASGLKFMTTDFQNLEDPKVLDLAQKGDRACDNNANGVEGVMHRLLSLFGSLIVLLGTSAVITLLHPLLLAAIVALLVINFYVSSRARRLDKTINDRLAKVWRRINYISRVMSDFAYGKAIRLFGMKGFLLLHYSKEQSRLIEGNRQIQRVWLQSKSMLAVTRLVQEAIMYVWLCWQVVAHGMSIGDFTMYSVAIRTFSSALNRIFDEGRIVEYGTHDELLARGGLYRKMWNAQAQWYVKRD